VTDQPAFQTAVWRLIKLLAVPSEPLPSENRASATVSVCGPSRGTVPAGGGAHLRAAGQQWHGRGQHVQRRGSQRVCRQHNGGGNAVGVRVVLQLHPPLRLRRRHAAPVVLKLRLPCPRLRHVPRLPVLPQPARAAPALSVCGEQQSVATPQAARGWARPPCRHFKIQSC
jgi:hypothetical protein